MIAIVVLEGLCQCVGIDVLSVEAGSKVLVLLYLLLLHHSPLVVSEVVLLEHVSSAPLLLLSNLFASLFVLVEHASQLLLIPHGGHSDFAFRFIAKGRKEVPLRMPDGGWHHRHDHWLLHIWLHEIVLHRRRLLPGCKRLFQNLREIWSLNIHHLVAFWIAEAEAVLSEPLLEKLLFLLLLHHQILHVLTVVAHEDLLYFLLLFIHLQLLLLVLAALIVRVRRAVVDWFGWADLARHGTDSPRFRYM